MNSITATATQPVNRTTERQKPAPPRRWVPTGWRLAGTALIVLALLAGVAWLYGWFGAATAPPTAESQEPESFTTTAWGKQYELFIEAPPLVAKQPIKFACHVTDLTTGKPLDSGTVTVRATGNGSQSIESAKTSPARAGIFLVELTFPAPGAYTCVVSVAPKHAPREEITLAAKKVCGTLAEVPRKSTAVAAQQVIQLLKEQQWRLAMLTQFVQQRDLVDRLTVPGIVRSPTGTTAMVTPPTPGTLFPPPDGRFPRIGETVEKDQPVAVLEPTLAGPTGVQLLANRAQVQSLDADLTVKQLQLETAAKVAERELAVARRTLTRLESLVASGTTTAKQLDQARLDVQLAEQRLQGAREQLHPYAEARAKLAAILAKGASDSTGTQQTDLRVVLRSPIRGSVVDAHATAGQYLNIGEQIFSLVNLDKMWIEARVSEYDLGRVQQAPGASYRLSAYPNEIVPILGEGGGHLIDVGAVVDPQNRTVPVRYEVANPEHRLRVDMFAEVLVETRRHERALSVPFAAILEEGAESFVVVQITGESFEQRPVKLGIRDADWIEIVEGLRGDERIVVHGARAIRLAALSGAMPAHDHDH